MLSFNRPKNKYRATPTDGFPSKLEAAVFQILELREKAGDISDLRRQHAVDLGFGIRWKVDFSFILVATGERYWVEAKGIEDATYRHKVKMWRNGAGPGSLEIWKGSYKKPYLDEVITPKKLKQEEK